MTAAEEKSERQRLGKKSNNNTVASDLVSSSTPSTASPHHQQSPSNQQENSTPFDQRHSLIGASARPSFTAPKTIILDTQLLEESKRLRFPAFTSVPEDFSAAVTDSSSPLVLNKVVAGKPKAVFGKASTGRLDEIKKEKPKIDATAELDVFLTGRKVETVKEPARSSQITRQQNLQKIKLVASDKDYYAINEKSTSINEYDQEEHIDGHRGDDDESRFHHHQTHHDDQNDDDDIYRSADYLNNDSKSSSLQSLQYRALAPLVVSEIMFEPLMPNNIFHSVNQVEEVTMRYARLLENKARALRGEPPLEEPVVPADQLARNVSKPNPTKDVVRSSKDSLAAVPITTSATENTVLPKTSTSDQQIPAPQSNLNETTASLIAAVDKPATSESTTTTTTKTTGNRPASDHSISAISGITTSGSIVIQPPMSSYDPMNNDLSTQTSRLPSVLPSAESSTYDHNAGSKISQYRIQKENEYSGLVGGSGLEEFAEEDSDVDDNDSKYTDIYIYIQTFQKLTNKPT